MFYMFYQKKQPTLYHRCIQCSAALHGAYRYADAFCDATCKERYLDSWGDGWRAWRKKQKDA